MKRKKMRRIWFVLALAGSLALLTVGLVRLLTTYRSYQDMVAEYQNRHLLSIAASVSRGLEVNIDHYANSIQDFVLRSPTAGNEERYLDGSDRSILLSGMNQHLDMQRDTAASMSMQGPEGVVIGTSEVACGEADSHPAEQTVVHLTESGGRTYLSCCYARQTGAVYSVHVPLDEFMDYAARDVLVEGVLFVADQGAETYCWASQGGFEGLTRCDMALAYPDLTVARLAAQFGERASVSVVLDEEKTGAAPYLLSCTRVPLSDNALIIGAVQDRDEVLEPTRTESLRLAWSGLLLGLGVVLLVVMLLSSRRSNEEAAREIDMLQERSRLLEEINANEQRDFHAQRLQEVGTMAAGIVHEFNNLLTPIMGYSMMTLDTLAPEDTESYDNLLEIYAASQKAKDVVKQIGQLSRRNADLTFRSLEFDAMIGQVLTMATMAAQGPVQLQSSLNCPGVHIHGNETMLHQTVLNLCINACQSMGVEGGTLWVETQIQTRQDRPWVCLTVRDSGPGIDPAIMDRIFEPFFTTKVSGVGTGLGLAISRHVAGIHGGILEAFNHPEGGACFELRLPAVEHEPEED